MKSYFKFLQHNKLYTAIEAVGLSVSLAFVILIGSYVWQQYAVTWQTPAAGRIFCLGTPDMLAMSFWDKEELEDHVPEIEAVTRVAVNDDVVATVGDEAFVVDVMETDREFFDIFQEIKVQEGSVDAFGIGANALVSRSFAGKISESGNLIGRQITVDDEEYTVAGIVDDIHASVIKYADVIVPPINGFYKNAAKFSVLGTHLTFFRMMEGVDKAAFKQKVLDLCAENYSKHADQLAVYSLKEAFFHPACYITNRCSRGALWVLTVVALLLLVSAVFNYINLSMALTGKRAKEMAVRRLLGSNKKDILGKYLAEALLFTTVCFAVALLLAYALVPTVNSLLRSGLANENDILLQVGFTPAYLLVYIGFVLLVGLLSGLLPAVAASHYTPIDVVRGTFRRRSKMVFSKIFIVIQNVFAVSLISLSIVMEMQMQHMVDRPLHADTENLFILDFGARTVAEVQPLADELRKLPQVESIGFGRGFPGSVGMSLGSKVNDEIIYVSVVLCDTAYFRMLGLDVVEDFGRPLPNSLWLGESAFRSAAVSDTSVTFAGKFKMNGAKTEYIGGVVKDFPTRGAADAGLFNMAGDNVGIMVQKPENLVYSCGVLVKTAGDRQAAEDAVMAAFRDFQQKRLGVYVEPWQHGYINDINLKQLEQARATMRLLELFMILSVMISLLGLAAMAAYFSRENTQQIAIRKVFGGDVRSETVRTVLKYMVMVLVAVVIALPVSVFAVGKYLEQFAYRIDGYWWVFIVSAVVAFAISFGAVVWQTVSAARTQPSEALKKE